MIKILHLYYDLLNQYGEQGNILALKDSFRNQNGLLPSGNNPF